MGVVSDFSAGLRAHGAGVRFAFSNKNYLALILIPFVLTLLLFVVGFSVFAAYGDAVLAWFWSVDPAAADGVTAALYWFFTHVVKYLLYLALLALMYFLFMVVANILASPLYDHIAGKIMSEAGLSEAGVSEAQGLSIAAVMCEELKKAGFVIVVNVSSLRSTTDSTATTLPLVHLVPLFYGNAVLALELSTAYLVGVTLLPRHFTSVVARLAH